MAIRVVIALCAVMLTVLAGCSSDSTSPSNTDPLITGTTFLRADVNGFSFKCNQISNMSTEIAPTVMAKEIETNKYEISISGDSYSMSGIVTLRVSAVIANTTGTYEIGGSSEAAQITSNYNTGSLSTAGLYSSEAKDKGTLTITSFNTSKRRIAGTFSTNLFRQLSSAATIPVTKGTFEIGY